MADGPPTGEGLDLPFEDDAGTQSATESPAAAPDPGPADPGPANPGPADPAAVAAAAAAANATARRRRLREAASWLIPVAALGLGLGFRCVRQPVFVEPPGVAGGLAAVPPGQVVGLGLFPRTEGTRKVTITGVHLRGATKGLQLVKSVAVNLRAPTPGAPTPRPVIAEPVQSDFAAKHSPKELRDVVFQSGNGYYLVIEVKADKAGNYTADGVNITYKSGVQRGTHHMKVRIALTVANPTAPPPAPGN